MRILSILFALIFIFTSNCLANLPEGVDEIQLGNLKIISIVDANTTMEESLLPDLIKHPELKPLFDHGPLPAVAKTWLVSIDGHLVLFDSGWGNELKIKGHTVEILEKMGIKPQDITDIIMTHLDFDHIGGLTKEDKAVFPNAVIWISKPEFEAWMSGKILSRPEMAIKRAQAIQSIYKDHIKTFDFGQQILPGIFSIDASGHTPGHTAFEIVSGNSHLIIAGDLIHIAQIQFAHPEMSTVYDADQVKAAASRKSLLEKAVNDNALFGGMHFYMTSPVRKADDGSYLIRQPR